MNEGADFDSPFAVKLRRFREISGQSLRSVARKSGISAALLCQVEHGRRLPSRSTIERLAEVLHVAPSQLLRHDPREGVEDFLDAARKQPAARPYLVQIFRHLTDGKIGSAELRRLLEKKVDDAE